MGTERKMTLESGHRAGAFGAGHSDHKESKATIPLNVSTDTVFLPNFIVIKIPKTVLLHAPLWPCPALVPESFTPIFHIISSFMRRKRNSRSECVLSGPRVGPRWHKKSGRRPPCLTSMVSEATCGAEREVEVVKANEALEGHATTPTASKEKEDK